MKRSMFKGHVTSFAEVKIRSQEEVNPFSPLSPEESVGTG